MKFSMCLIIFSLAVSACGKKTNNKSNPEIQPLVIDEVGVWESECLSFPKRKIQAVFGDDGEFIKTTFFYGFGNECKDEYLTSVSSLQYQYVISGMVDSNILALDLTDDNNTTTYHSLILQGQKIFLSNGHTASPSARIISFNDDEGLTKIP